MKYTMDYIVTQYSISHKPTLLKTGIIHSTGAQGNDYNT